MKNLLFKIIDRIVSGSIDRQKRSENEKRVEKWLLEERYKIKPKRDILLNKFVK